MAQHLSSLFFLDRVLDVKQVDGTQAARRRRTKKRSAAAEQQRQRARLRGETERKGAACRCADDALRFGLSVLLTTGRFVREDEVEGAVGRDRGEQRHSGGNDKKSSSNDLARLLPVSPSTTTRTRTRTVTQTTLFATGVPEGLEVAAFAGPSAPLLPTPALGGPLMASAPTPALLGSAPLATPATGACWQLFRASALPHRQKRFVLCTAAPRPVPCCSLAPCPRRP